MMIFSGWDPFDGFGGCLWIILAPAMGVACIIGVYLLLMNGVKTAATTRASAGYWMTIAALCAAAAFCFLSLLR